jgi:nucleoside-diphosphate-sugar epimerase
VRVLARAPERARALADLGIEIIKGDLLDAADVERAVRGVSHVYHLAALYREARYPDRTYWDVNVGGTEKILAAAGQHGVARVVHCSTVGVHGDVEAIPSDETAPFAPGDIYQRTKLEAEQRVQDAIQHGLPATIFRPVGIYGPGDLRFLKLFKTIHTGRFRMIGSGRVQYHLTYIDDLVDGIIMCGETPAARGKTYILAGPRYTTVEELVERVAAAVGCRPPRGHVPLGPVRVAAFLCELACRPLGIEPPLHRRRLDFFAKDRAFSTEKARAELGFVPRVDLDTGLARTAQWYFETGHLVRRASRASGPAPAAHRESQRETN